MNSETKVFRDAYHELDEIKQVLEWASHNVTDLWMTSQWCGYLRGREQKGPAHFVGETIYQSLYKAWENRDK